jgi:DUF4097 and DUF4098 domain-containing protein YvlB
MRVSPWGRVVLVSALLVVGGAAALVAGAFASSHERRVSYPVTGSLNGLAFDIGDGDIVIAGGGRRDAATVERTERYAFGHDAVTSRTTSGSVLRVRSRCPSTLLGRCSISYRVVVPDNVPVDVRTSGGHVTLSGYRGSARVVTGSGDVDVDGYCGNSLELRTDSGEVATSAECAPPRLVLRTGSGDAQAVVPTGRYDVDAESTSGRASVRGLASSPDAPYTIQALSASGDVTVEGRR